MPLKALEIKAFQAKDMAYRISDEKGLYVEVFPNGSKLWRLKYRFAGKEKRLALGSWPDVSLADARNLRDEARAKLREGIDPSHERRMEKISRRSSAGNTFESVAKDFIQVRMIDSGNAPATIEKAQWFLSLLAPTLGKRPIAEIEAAEVLAVLKKLERKGTVFTAQRTRAFASRVFRYGVARAVCKHDPAALLQGAIIAPRVKHHAAILEPSILGEFLRAVDTYEGGPIVKLAMQIAPHVFLRPGELRYGRWEEIDWKNHTWTIPGARTKLRRPHVAPLSSQVMTLLQSLRTHSDGDGLMFPGQRSHLRPISENTLNATYRRLGFSKDVVTSHGLRATASTLLNESGRWHIDAIERALAHGHSDAVRGAYARGQHWAERVTMAQWWSDFLDRTRDGANTISQERHRSKAQ